MLKQSKRKKRAQGGPRGEATSGVAEDASEAFLSDAEVRNQGPLSRHRDRDSKLRAEYGQRIVRDSRICGGQPVIKGTRVTLRTVLASLAEGATTAQILEDFPTLAEEDVRAVIAFAAASTQEDLPTTGAPAIP